MEEDGGERGEVAKKNSCVEDLVFSSGMMGVAVHCFELSDGLGGVRVVAISRKFEVAIRGRSREDC